MGDAAGGTADMLHDLNWLVSSLTANSQDLAVPTGAFNVYARTRL